MLCAADVRSVLVNRHEQVVDLVWEAYGKRECVNAQSECADPTWATQVLDHRTAGRRVRCGGH